MLGRMRGGLPGWPASPWVACLSSTSAAAEGRDAALLLCCVTVRARGAPAMGGFGMGSAGQSWVPVVLGASRPSPQLL